MAQLALGSEGSYGHAPCNGEISSSLPIIFSLQDGKIICSMKRSSVGESVNESCVTASTQDIRETDYQEDEVYIEIFRRNEEEFVRRLKKEHIINSISSAYAAFWEYDYQECLQRRSCIVCGRVFLTPRQLILHLQQSHEVKNPEECFVCHKFFLSKPDIMAHFLREHGINEPDLVCEVCFQNLVSQQEKEVHRLVHKSVIKCQWCSESFPCNFLLNSHLYHCFQRKSDLECQICGCSFRSSNILQLHTLRHQHAKCDICQYNLSDFPENTEVVLIQHFKSAHSISEINNILLSFKKQDEDEENLDRMFMSQVCTNLNLVDCDTSVGDIGLVDKQDIDKEQSDRSKLHLEHLPPCEAPEESATSFKCLHCCKDFGTTDDLIEHSLVHQNPFKCEICNLKFPHRRVFKKHMHSHGMSVKPGNIQYKCNLCSVQCRTMSSLRIHLLTHTNQKPYLCDKCGLRFRRPRALKAHEHAVHSSRTLEFCPNCGISSFSKSSLLRHIQCVHGQGRRFICGMCSYRCFQNQDLRRHLRVAHNINFPPLERLSKKSTKEIHVIPPAVNLRSTDPLAILLKSAIQEEQLKLQGLSDDKIQCSLSDESHLHLSNSECSTDNRHSLNILGDVASRATPIDHLGSSSKLSLPPIDLGAQHSLKPVGGGCLHSSYNIEYPSSHLLQYDQQKNFTLSNPVKNPVPVNSSNSLVFYSLHSIYSPSLSSLGAPVVSTLPCQFYVLPQQNFDCFNSESAAGPIMSSDLISNVLQTPNLFSMSTLPTSSTFQIVDNAASHSISSSRNENISIDAEHSAEQGCSNSSLDTETRKGSASSNTANCLKPHQFVNQMKSISPYFSTSENQQHSPSSSGILENTEEREESFIFTLSQSDDSTLPSSPLLDPYRTLAEQINDVPTKFLSENQKFIGVSKEWTLAHQNEPLKAASSKLEREGNSKDGEGSHQPQHDKNIDYTIELSKDVPSGDAEHTNKAESVLSKSSQDLSRKLVSLSKLNESKINELHVDQNSSTCRLKGGKRTCPECGKQLSCLSNFRRHLQVHFGEKPHKCPHCDKSFQYKFNLTVHMRTHSGARPYECSVCHKRLRYRTEFKEHQQLHEGSKSFKCQNCGQVFARQRDLNRHSHLHSNESKPTCPVCQKSFSRADYLKRHIRSHGRLEDTDNNQCIKRGPDLLQSNILSKRKENSEIETTFVCELCGLDLITRTEYEAHNNFCKGKSNVEGTISSLQHGKYLLENGNVSIDPSLLPHSSQDLISVALQAAEDGVEFMFSEGHKSSSEQLLFNEQDTSIVYVQILNTGE